MEINVLIEEGLEGYVEAGWLESIAGEILGAERSGSDAELGLVIVGQEKIRQLNLSYRGIDEPTDVLSFGMIQEPSGAGQSPFVPPPDGIEHLGEVIISYPQAVIQAGESGHSVKREIAILVIHGILHLLGYDHEEPGMELEMKAREAEILGYIEGGLE